MVASRGSRETLMRSVSLLRLATLGEGLLVLIALVWARWRETVFVLGGATEEILIGDSIRNWTLPPLLIYHSLATTISGWSDIGPPAEYNTPPRGIGEKPELDPIRWTV